MTNPTNTDQNNPIEVFAGTAWEVALVESLLENAEIKVYVYYGGEGTMAPWDSGGGLPINRVMVASSDAEKAKQVIKQYYEAMRKENFH
ncbi:MAG TPA: DUF2007 domain-containing protein [Bacteroidales bacterium]|nr:DUF2007 domain-containing protein [Bacteroidales bacterium]